MNKNINHARPATQGWLSRADCDLQTFVAIVNQTTDIADYPHASETKANVVIYDAPQIIQLAADPAQRRVILEEIRNVLSDGPGVVAFRRAFVDSAVVDRASAIFGQIIVDEHREKTGGGDHFAKPGSNDRIWNALEKHCLADAENFARYYGNDIVALASEAWLGPVYQVTAQVNRVNPGGAAQTPHRDYHLGFQTAEIMEQYPAHVHALSPVLTLQGAVAHNDMPLETGPTLLMPYSHQYLPGYLAVTLPEFRDYFEKNHIQLPLQKGDAMFFNPALFHAAGSNTTSDVQRLANLLQVSSPFGRAMESVNRDAMCDALYPSLRELAADGVMSGDAVNNAVRACAEGYSFPTNLDRDPPLHGLAPLTQVQLMLNALAEGWESDAFSEKLKTRAAQRQP